MGFESFVSYSLAALVGWATCTIVARIYFHPLSSYPGPKLAAATRLYEWYLDCIKPGIHYQKIREWHRRYGPIVRIGPNEVHIDDPDWFDVLYNPNTKLDKDPQAYSLLGRHDSAFVTIEHDVHRVKRSKQNVFFSRQSVDKSAPLLANILQSMLDRMKTFQGSGRPVALRNAAKSFATDVVCEYSFPQGMGFVKSPDFSATYHKGQEGLARNGLWFRHFPILPTILNGAPSWSVRFMGQDIQALLGFFQFVEAQVDESLRQSEREEPVTKKTIIRELHESNLPAEYRSRQVLMQEALGFVSGGSDTTSRAIEGGIFHILDNPAIAKRLTEEIRGYKPEQTGLLTQRELESLPYLSAVVLECQRKFTAITSRLPRINRNQDMFYHDWRIPKGTIIGMTPFEVLRDDRVWGHGDEFDPSRWLDAERKLHLQKYMVAFGRGSRSCIGQNLAVAELYLFIGNLFRSFDLELFETDIREIECVQDCFVPKPYRGSKGVQLLLR